MKSNRLFLLFAIMVLTTAACVAGAVQTPNVEPERTEAPPTEEIPVVVTEESNTDAPPSMATAEPTALPETFSMDEQLAQVDDILKKSARASIAYNAPSEMQVDETVTIELLLNPSLPREELEKQISEPGAVHSRGDVEITSLMKAKLVPQDRSAFLVDARPDEEHAIQVISSTETTKWAWNVTAQKPGTQRLTISLSRLVKYEGEEFWREIGEYEADIVVEVTFLSRLQSLGWPWIVALLVILAAASVIWQRGKPRQRSRLPAAGPDGKNLGGVFISYRRADSADITGRIYDHLVEEFGPDLIFKDVVSIPLGVDFKEYLHKHVHGCRVLLATIGDDWVDARDAAGKRRLEDPDDFVRLEIESALESGIPVIPLLVRGAKMPLEKDLPPSLRKLVYQNGIAIRPDPDFHNDMRRLIAALNQYIGP